MLVKYINRMASSAMDEASAIHEKASGSKDASAINTDYKDYSTPSYADREIVLPIRRSFSRIRINLISKINEFVRDNLNQRDIEEFQITNLDQNIGMLKNQIHKKTLQDIISIYSYKSNPGLSFIQGEIQLILESVLTFFNNFTSTVIETTDPILLKIALELLNLISKYLTLYSPVTVTFIVEKFERDLKNMENKNNELAELIIAADLAAKIRWNARVERSRIKNFALAKQEDEMLSKRLKLTQQKKPKQSNNGGKSMKPKQHRNGKTQKKRQRKNQKK